MAWLCQGSRIWPKCGLTRRQILFRSFRLQRNLHTNMCRTQLLGYSPQPDCAGWLVGFISTSFYPFKVLRWMEWTKIVLTSIMGCWVVDRKLGVITIEMTFDWNVVINNSSFAPTMAKQDECLETSTHVFTVIIISWTYDNAAKMCFRLGVEKSWVKIHRVVTLQYSKTERQTVALGKSTYTPYKPKY